MFVLHTESNKFCFYWEVMCFSFSFVFGKQTSKCYRLFHLTLSKEVKKHICQKGTETLRLVFHGAWQQNQEVQGHFLAIMRSAIQFSLIYGIL